MRDSDFKRKLFWECIDNLGSKGRSSAAKLAEPALHIPQQGQHKICPQCGGNLVEMYQADVYICNDCGIKVTGKLRA